MTCTFLGWVTSKRWKIGSHLFRLGEKASTFKESIFTKFETALIFPDDIVYSPSSRGYLLEFHLQHDSKCILVKAQAYLTLVYCLSRWLAMELPAAYLISYVSLTLHRSRLPLSVAWHASPCAHWWSPIAHVWADGGKLDGPDVLSLAFSGNDSLKLFAFFLLSSFHSCRQTLRFIRLHPC